ncbi:MAG: hypothetical protein FD168_2157 [Desulfobulbaceae bacterium]|nr:MAG: hypothetical protein FD168_2157 [Desulfobulbaceae bacterium]
MTEGDPAAAADQAVDRRIGEWEEAHIEDPPEAVPAEELAPDGEAAGKAALDHVGQEEAAHEVDRGGPEYGAAECQRGAKSHPVNCSGRAADPETRHPEADQCP